MHKNVRFVVTKGEADMPWDSVLPTVCYSKTEVVLQIIEYDDGRGKEDIPDPGTIGLASVEREQDLETPMCLLVTEGSRPHAVSAYFPEKR